jgi:hypothetical protein
VCFQDISDGDEDGDQYAGEEEEWVRMDWMIDTTRLAPTTTP